MQTDRVDLFTNLWKTCASVQFYQTDFQHVPSSCVSVNLSKQYCTQNNSCTFQFPKELDFWESYQWGYHPAVHGMGRREAGGTPRKYRKLYPLKWYILVPSLVYIAPWTGHLNRYWFDIFVKLPGLTSRFHSSCWDLYGLGVVIP